MPFGKQGEIAITNLVNRASVLLNYCMDDLATMLSDEPCGRTIKRMSEVEGRTEDILPLPEAGFVDPRSVWRAVKGEKGILQYQFIQHAYDRYTLHMVLNEESTLSGLQARLLPALRELVGGDSSVEFKSHSQPLRREGQKFRVVISELRGKRT